MLINLKIENWMSYRDSSEITMVATREQHHGGRVPKVKRIQTRILPIVVVFGGNASGKTNLFKALGFAKYMITQAYRMGPDDRIPAEPFLLDEKSRLSPTSMAFTLLIGDDVWEYAFVLNEKRVLEERLDRTTAPAEGVGFKRIFNAETQEYDFTPGRAHEVEKDHLALVLKATRSNQLFLLNSVMQNVAAFKPVYDWFAKTLCLVSPVSGYGPMENYADEDSPRFARLNKLLASFDTGIKRIRRQEIDLAALPVPKDVVDEIVRRLTEGKTVRVEAPGRIWPYLLTKREGRVVAEKLIPCHASHDGSEREFELEHESDGTKRIVDLLPAFVDLEAAKMPRVYVIDELDRCLHTCAARKLLTTFLDACTNETRSQLLTTTHDVGLLSQALLRRDEMWLAERNKDEVSSVFAISDFADARKDTDLRTSYLSGRMGGLPDITTT